MFSGEQDDKYHELCELLVAGGYFRARIAGLTPFDKIAGGLAWAILASREAIDVEFVEDASIRDKIKIGENIEAALRGMKCPAPLAAYQIQGLDYPSIFPVVQWLLKRVIATREENERSMRVYAALRFNRSLGEFPDDTPKPIFEPRVVPKRELKRQGENEFTNEEDHVLSVLLEYGMKSKLLEEAKEDALQEDDRRRKDEAELEREAKQEEAKLEQLTSDMGAYKAVTKMASRGVDAQMKKDAEAIARAASEFNAKQEELRKELEKEEEAKHALQRVRNKIERRQREIEEQRRKIAEAEQELQAQAAETDKVKKVVEKAERKNKRIIAEIERIGGEMDDKRQAALTELANLMKKNEQLQEKKEELMEQCKKRLAEWKAKIESARTDKPVQENEHYKQVEDQLHEEKEKYNKLMTRIAKKNREISNLQRQIDDIPTRSELLQYEKRFTELYEQVRWKFEETKQYYNRYNTLNETVGYLKKEMDLLDSIHEKFDIAMSSKAREDFPSSIERIVESVKKSRDKVEQKLGEEKKMLQLLMDQCNSLLTKQRAYFQAVKEFQEECAKNEQLRQKLERARAKAGAE